MEAGGRRAFLASLAAAAGALTVPAAAQDPRINEARGSALGWLAMVDAADAAGSYRSSAQKFQAVLTPGQWALALQGSRVPRGRVIQRALASSGSTRQFKGQPDGDYVILIFRTVFASRVASSETLTMEREGDGVWRVVGYSIT